MHAAGRRARLRALLLAVLVAAGVAVLAPPAEGHALLRSSTPPDGAQLDAPPGAITLSFTEPPDPSLSTIRVVGEGGVEVATGTPERTGAAELTASLEGVEDGAAYSVTWRVVSEVDGHPSAGAFSFGVGVPAVPAGTEAVPVEVPATSPLEIVARALLFLGLGALIGASVTGAAAFERPPRAALTMGVVGGVVGAAGIALLAVAQRAAAAVSLAELLGTPVGRALVWRAVPAVVALAGAALAATGRRPRVALGVAGVAAAGSLLAHVTAGHAAAKGVGAQVAGQWVHVVAAAVWLGGLAALVAAVRGEPREEKRRAGRRFSAAAGVALAVVLATGVIRSIEEVGSWGDLFSTGYGRLVLIKVGLIVALALLGAVNRYRHVPRLDRSTRPLRRVGGVELVLAGAAVVAAAGLASLVPPATVPAAAERPAALEVRGSDFATSVRAVLGVDPGLPGPNSFRLRVEDFDSGEPVDADAVTLRFRPLGRPDVGETTLALAAAEVEGTYEAAGPNLAAGGPWDVVAVVQRGADAVEVPFELATLCPTQTVEGEGDQPTIHLFDSPSGGSTEGYVIPLGGNRTEVHFTFIDADGAEARVADLSMTAWRPGAGVRTLEPIPLTRGHYFADASLDGGDWRFDAVAELADGSTASGCFEQTS